MNKNSVKKNLFSLTAAFTIVNLTNAGLNMITGINTVSAPNTFRILLWCTIGIIILNTHKLFINRSALFMILIQYFTALTLVYGTVLLESFFIPLHKNAIRDVFRSFTVFYIIGALFYYISLYREAAVQNRLIQEIKRKKEL